MLRRVIWSKIKPPLAVAGLCVKKDTWSELHDELHVSPSTMWTVNYVVKSKSKAQFFSKFCYITNSFVKRKVNFFNITHFFCFDYHDSRRFFSITSLTERSEALFKELLIFHCDNLELIRRSRFIIQSWAQQTIKILIILCVKSYIAFSIS